MLICYLFFKGTWTKGCLVSSISFIRHAACICSQFIFVLVKLNGGRNIVGILRGFDPFMNLVIDETVEETKDGNRNNIGMVVSTKNLD